MSKKAFFVLGLGILKASSIETCSLILGLVLNNEKLEQLKGDLFSLVFYLICTIESPNSVSCVFFFFLDIKLQNYLCFVLFF